MSEYESMVKRQRKWMLFLLVIILLGVLIGAYPTFFNGLLLGGLISFYNLWNLQRKISRWGQAVANERSARGIGSFTRLVCAGLAVAIAIQFEAYFHLVGVVIGIMLYYVVIMIDFGIRTFTHQQ